MYIYDTRIVATSHESISFHYPSEDAINICISAMSLVMLLLRSMNHQISLSSQYRFSFDIFWIGRFSCVSDAFVCPYRSKCIVNDSEVSKIVEISCQLLINVLDISSDKFDDERVDILIKGLNELDLNLDYVKKLVSQVTDSPPVCRTSYLYSRKLLYHPCSSTQSENNYWPRSIFVSNLSQQDQTYNRFQILQKKYQISKII